MSVSTGAYALLAQQSYQKPDQKKEVQIEGARYRAIDYMDDPVTGFQATAYQCIDTQEVVIAFRGTEFDRQPIRDGGVDAGMVLSGVNAQTPDALAFTQRVMNKAKNLEELSHQHIPVSVTGHSLGGTLAEISASHFGLKGETFNAYGAAGLLQNVPQGGHQVIDHVRATDVVSAASPHFGEVRVYAAPQDIETLTKAGYRDNSGLLSPRDPFEAIDFKAHAIDNFVPQSKLLGQSIISPQGEALYNEHKTMIDRYRNDVLDLRTGLSASWEIPRTAVDLGERAGHLLAKKIEQGARVAEHDAKQLARQAGTAIDHARHEIQQDLEHGIKVAEHGARVAAHTVEHGAQLAAHAVEHGVHVTARAVEHGADAAMQATEHVYDNVRKDLAHGTEVAGRALRSVEESVHDKASHALESLSHPGSWFEKSDKPLLNQPTHPDHALFQQARTAVHRLDASHQRVPDERSEQMAGALTVAARQSGLQHIDHVVLSDDASRAYAVQGELQSPFKRIAALPTAEAMTTPISESSDRWAQQQVRQANAASATQNPAMLQPGFAPGP